MSSLSSIGKWVGHYLLFSDILESDKRVPYLTFTPANFLRWFGIEDFIDKTIVFGLLVPSIEFWTCLIVILIMGAMFASICCYVMYHYIVIPRKNATKLGIDLDITPFIIGFGFIMPFCAVSPYYILRYFGIRNKLMKFLAATTQLTLFFRCSEAMFGFLPPHVDKSLTNMLIYTAFPVEIKFDSKGVLKSDWQRVKYNLIQWVKYIFILGLYCSMLHAYNYEPYPNEEGPRLQDIKLATLSSPRQLVNNIGGAVLFQILLTTFGFGLNFLTSLAGVQQIQMMLNPIFESTSPSDFWGRRWNMVVHGILKRGVYKPVRSKYSRHMASLATFIASGLFHEWLLSVVFQPDREDDVCDQIRCYIPGYGRNTLFFVWNALVIGMEYAIGGLIIFKYIHAHLPLTIVSLLVVASALPAAHWFMNDYIRSDFFQDMAIGFPIIVRV